MRKSVKTRSGLTGWQDKLQNVYTSFEDFKRYAEMYNLHTRLGYRTPESVWRHNPTVQGSVEPSDYCKINKRGRRVFAE